HGARVRPRDNGRAGADRGDRSCGEDDHAEGVHLHDTRVHRREDLPVRGPGPLALAGIPEGRGRGDRGRGCPGPGPCGNGPRRHHHRREDHLPDLPLPGVLTVRTAFILAVFLIAAAVIAGSTSTPAKPSYSVDKNGVLSVTCAPVTTNETVLFANGTYTESRVVMHTQMGDVETYLSYPERPKAVLEYIPGAGEKISGHAERMVTYAAAGYAFMFVDIRGRGGEP